MTTFKEIGLKATILKALDTLGFETPTPIQEKTIPHLLESNKDLLAFAQTGTGKTAAFGLPVLNQIDTDSTDTQCLILCPTRELCLQISNDLVDFSKFIQELKVTAVYGGDSIERQIKELNKGAQVVVGTPGRVGDLIRRRRLKIANIKWMVLDEADEMLSMGFKEELDTILSETPAEKQTLLFSATMPKTLTSIAKKYMKSPDEISVGGKNKGAETVSHEYYMVRAKDRYTALKRIADINPAIYGIVFCRTRRETKEVADSLIRDGYNADAIHGDLSQAQREHVMKRFKQQSLQLLVATDVAARGLDVNNLTHVINYNLPDSNETYVHRSGRTGRAGKEGVSITIIHSREKGRIRDIQKKVGKNFTYRQVPGGQEICEKQLYHLVDKMEHVEVNEAEVKSFLPEIFKKLDWMSKEELIKHFVSLEFNRFLDYYKNAPDININENTREPKDGKTDEGRSKNRKKSVQYTRFFLNIGKKSKLNPASLIELITSKTENKTIEIGEIEILKTFSFFEVEKSEENAIMKGFQDSSFNDIPLAVEVSNPKAKKSQGGFDHYDRPKKKKTGNGKKYSDSKFNGRKNRRRK